MEKNVAMHWRNKQATFKQRENVNEEKREKYLYGKQKRLSTFSTSSLN
jgi:hypothetical protein